MGSDLSQHSDSPVTRTVNFPSTEDTNNDTFSDIPLETTIDNLDPLYDVHLVQRRQHPASGSTLDGAGADELMSKPEDNAKAPPAGRDVPGFGTEMKEIFALALPALGSVIADPLMSLVDTGCVGQLSSLQLAALGPNTAIFNFVFQVFTFLGVVTTNLIATNSPHAPELSVEERRRSRQDSGNVLAQSLTLAALCGAACCAVMQAAPSALLSLMGCSPEMLPHAAVYLRIRSLASPAVMVMCVCQGACLGQQDAWTPLRIFVLAGMFNLVWDLYLILHLHMGIAGAAIATVSAQYLGAFVFLWLLHTRGNKPDGVPLRWRGLPTWVSIQPFLTMSSTLIARVIFQMTGYAIVTYSATTLGTVASAAHQVTLQLFWFFSYFPEPLSITAQSLIARDMRQPARVQRMAKMLMGMGFIIGLFLALSVVAAYTFLPRLFTHDEHVATAIRTLRPQAFISILTLSAVMVMDGVSIGSGDFAHLPRTSLVATIGTWSLLTAASRLEWGLEAVWWGMVVFFGLRFFQQLLHVATNWQRHPLGCMALAGVSAASLRPSSIGSLV
mmetsp:Transcript_10055/g.18936  ORF Transcript_10055/g.18936 Transcript_10055/m.18936 type:complete len:557 (-) Transcript_10055:245-1915(-)|eukprot:CAMPEP_0114224378 /NCGR_PEP_ID=MMETSP0058-20121206/75_1 /TAXON_ID=36894 /ORGANISM="Pyramimonas parkeae, CCMP726" /LENGTH=556 /DNA_ID=CAMNT_0001334849 /DNA_START=670 /DNA_END=2340 /DNA_ORIENTATION=+